MNDGLAFNAVIAVSLDDGGSLARLALLDHGALPIPISVVIAMTLANGHAGANRADPNANILSHGRRRQGAGGRGNKQILLHFVLLPVELGVNVMGSASFQWDTNKKAQNLQACSSVK
jgi:hypothetical protein